MLRAHHTYRKMPPGNRASATNSCSAVDLKGGIIYTLPHARTTHAHAIQRDHILEHSHKHTCTLTHSPPTHTHVCTHTHMHGDRRSQGLRHPGCVAGDDARHLHARAQVLSLPHHPQGHVWQGRNQGQSWHKGACYNPCTTCLQSNIYEHTCAWNLTCTSHAPTHRLSTPASLFRRFPIVLHIHISMHFGYSSICLYCLHDAYVYVHLSRYIFVYMKNIYTNDIHIYAYIHTWQDTMTPKVVTLAVHISVYNKHCTNIFITL